MNQKHIKNKIQCEPFEVNSYIVQQVACVMCVCNRLRYMSAWLKLNVNKTETSKNLPPTTHYPYHKVTYMIHVLKI